MKTIDLKKELGERLFNDYIRLTGLDKVNQKNFIIYPDFFEKNTELIKQKNRKLYIFIRRNIIENTNYEFIEEIAINK